MGMVSPQVAADNWARGMGQAGEKMKAGVMAVTESPMEKAAQAVDRQVAGVMRAAQSGKTAANLRAVSMQAWKDAYTNIGVGRAAAAANTAKPKMAAFMQQFLPWVAQGQQKLASMPRGDVETNIARAVEMMRHNSQFRYQKS